ncbi:MAG TPA: tryptophan dimethylallyltransferase family protein [Amycolatopsis sp.]|uniref:tryptophan dimethylallyltransferase family protein n=1 Tax=Amycolatopsis sp. TaxID=37632 RepID=UPI002B4A6D33|nr:tryptophan dimethylallyltransferase family protein [Amycolatopsis sp.]HKS44856.1 tryptophan dimethylallyltransferase family protein [Amycolatopsis sp.]
MNVADVTLYRYTSEQLRNLCEVAGFEKSDNTPLQLLKELLGPAGTRPLSDGPLWPSDVADDATPVEFSLAFDSSGGRAIRVLGETINGKPSPEANAEAAKQLLATLAERFRLPLDRYHAVADLFLPQQPQGKFSLWFSLIFRPHSPPRVKVYFNPEVQGVGRARELVASGLRRLGIAHAYDTVEKHALRRGELDRFSFFAFDLDDGPAARLKLYVSHFSAMPEDVEHAARAVSGVDPALVSEFCSVIGGSGPFTGRPLVSSYSFVEDGGGSPGNYSLYLPIRSYTSDDKVARTRVLELMRSRGLDEADLDAAIRAVSRRQLADNVGLIPHVSLRAGRFDSGITVYLSSEAFAVTPVPLAT